MKWPLCILKREGLSDNTLFVIQRPEAFLVIYHILCKLHLINHISISSCINSEFLNPISTHWKYWNNQVVNILYIV